MSSMLIFLIVMELEDGKRQKQEAKRSVFQLKTAIKKKL